MRDASFRKLRPSLLVIGTFSWRGRCVRLRQPLHSGVRRKFSWGVSFSGIWWSFVFGMRCLWRHIHVFQTNVLAKFALISHSWQNKDNCLG